MDQSASASQPPTAQQSGNVGRASVRRGQAAVLEVLAGRGGALFAGGLGGDGGDANGTDTNGKRMVGGRGGDGEGGRFEERHFIAAIGASATVIGGIAGRGGYGTTEGGPGGTGRASQVVPDEWFFGDTTAVPITPLADFLKESHLDGLRELKEVLERRGIATVHGLLSLTPNNIRDMQVPDDSGKALKPGHIAELKSALKRVVAKHPVAQHPASLTHQQIVIFAVVAVVLALLRSFM